MSLQILNKYINVWGDFPGDTVVKNPPVNAGDARNAGWIPGWGRSPGAGNGEPTPVFLSGEFHGHESLGDYNP